MFLDMRKRYEQPTLALAFNLWVDIHAPIELVFNFISQEQLLNGWWATKSTSDPRPGGKLHCIWDGERIKTGDAIYRQFEPPVSLVVEWTHSDGEPILCDGDDPRGMHWPAINSYHLWQLNGTTTRLHLHDMGISAEAKYAGTYEAAREGWVQALTRLKRAVETRHRQEITKVMRKKSKQKPHPEQDGRAEARSHESEAERQ